MILLLQNYDDLTVRQENKMSDCFLQASYFLLIPELFSSRLFGGNKNVFF